MRIIQPRRPNLWVGGVHFHVEATARDGSVESWCIETRNEADLKAAEVRAADRAMHISQGWPVRKVETQYVRKPDFQTCQEWQTTPGQEDSQ